MPSRWLIYVDFTVTLRFGYVATGFPFVPLTMTLFVTAFTVLPTSLDAVARCRSRCRLPLLPHTRWDVDWLR